MSVLFLVGTFLLKLTSIHWLAIPMISTRTASQQIIFWLCSFLFLSFFHNGLKKYWKCPLMTFSKYKRRIISCRKQPKIVSIQAYIIQPEKQKYLLKQKKKNQKTTYGIDIPMYFFLFSKSVFQFSFFRIITQVHKVLKI